MRPPKLRQYPGLKEEYYLSDFEPDESVLDALGLDRERVLVVVRTPSDYALYHRNPSPLFPALLERLGRDAAVHAVVLARTAEQRVEVVARSLPSLVVPEHAVDAQSLIALSDLVVSAGGTMNREAVALGVPVYTTFGGQHRRRGRGAPAGGPPAAAGRSRRAGARQAHGRRGRADPPRPGSLPRPPAPGLAAQDAAGGVAAVAGAACCDGFSRFGPPWISASLATT